MDKENLVTPNQQQQAESQLTTHQTTSPLDLEEKELEFTLVTNKRKKVKRSSYKKQEEDKPYLKTRIPNRNKTSENTQIPSLSKQ
jgi:hypothetical protein